VIVVGSGPSALAAVRELVTCKIDLKITVLDSGNRKEPKNLVGLKSHFGSLFMYHQQNLIHENMRPVVWPSASKGGFSRVWGAVIGKHSVHEFSNVINFNDERYKSFTTLSCRRILDCYNSKRLKYWTLQEHRVAVDSNLCTMCGNCLTGCPTNAIWFAGDYWHVYSNIDFKENFRVSRIVYNRDKVTLYSDDERTISSDLVFLAAGPIASAQILIESNLIPNKVVFDDTQAVFFPALRLPIKENQNSFALSQISATMESYNGERNYLQLYPDSRNLASSIRMHKPIVGIAIAWIWRVISPFITTGIWYRDSRVSPKLTLIKTESNSFKLAKDVSGKITVDKFATVRVSWRILYNFGILPLFFVGKKAESGESYHFGASPEIIQFNSDLKTAKVKVIDASCLFEVVPGPITSIVMQNARKIVRETLRAQV